MSDSSSPGALDAICGVFLALSIVIVGLRFYTRSMQKLPLGIDDWAMLPCVVCPFRVKCQDEASLDQVQGIVHWRSHSSDPW